MKLRSYLSEIPVLIFIKLIPTMLYEYYRFATNCARAKMSKSPEKLLSDILMISHALEKGLSIHIKKQGFGLAKLELLVKGIHTYVMKYGYSEKLLIPLSVITQYIAYQENQGLENSSLTASKEKYIETLELLKLTKENLTKGGYLTLTKQNMLVLKKANFKDLCEHRYSFRHFSDERVTDEIIAEALEIAKKSPSACNRQSFRVHVYEGKQKNDVLYSQGGARSFYKEANRAIIVTADMERYFINEVHLGYVDGSLFAMSLIYAFTYLGIATIPLTICQPLKILKKFASDFGIPSNEYPVLVIALGHYPEKAEVSMSERYPVTDFTKFHKASR